MFFNFYFTQCFYWPGPEVICYQIAFGLTDDVAQNSVFSPTQNTASQNSIPLLTHSIKTTPILSYPYESSISYLLPQVNNNPPITSIAPVSQMTSPNQPGDQQVHSWGADNEQQLRMLTVVIQQYSQDYTQMVQRHGGTIRGTGTFQEFVNRIKMQNESEIIELYEGMKGCRRMLEEVLGKCMGVLPEVLKEMAQARAKMQAMQEQVDDLNQMVEGMREKKKEDERSLAQVTMLYEKYQKDNVQLNERINQKQQQFQSQSREIRKTFMEVSQSNEAQRQILTQLYENNQKLTITVNQLQREKQQTQKQLTRIIQQLNRCNLKIEGLESELGKKQQQIKLFENEIEQLQTSQRKMSHNSMGSNGMEEDEANLRVSFNDVNQNFKGDKSRLNQELYNYKMPTAKQLNGSFIGGTRIKRSIGDQSDYMSEYDQPTRAHRMKTDLFLDEEIRSKAEPRQLKRQVADPYFSHYILISQSVKIKQDCEDMLNIDMKPYYAEIIEKRIPMHLWDQWVKNRLRELLRKIEIAQ